MSDDRTPALARNRRNAAPVAWHPLFPAVVALWFAALFGLGALAIRGSLIEAAAVASHIDLLIPAAAPPLGMTARVLLALGLALVGGIGGLVIGRLLARSKPSAVARRAEAAAAKAAPTDVAEAVDALPSLDARSFIEISELDLGYDGRIDSEPAADIESYSAEPSETIAPAPKPVRRPDPAYFPLPAAFPVPGGAAAQRLISADLDDLSHLELIERLALSLQKRREENLFLDAPSAEVLSGRNTERPETEIVVEADAPPRLAAPAYYPPSPEANASRSAASPHPAYADEDEFADETPDISSGTSPDIGGPSDMRAVSLFREQPVAAVRQESVATERALRDALAALQRMSGAA